MKFVDIKCPFCNNPASKRAAEVKRQAKKGRPVYCGKECAIASNKLHGIVILSGDLADNKNDIGKYIPS